MSAIAAEAGVSKALLHYHFAHRAELLADLVVSLTDRHVEREHGALLPGSAAGAVDALWNWFADEVQRGELYVLLMLRGVQEPCVHTAVESMMRRRRAAAATTVSGLFARLGLTPRIPVELIGDATIVFVDGLVLDHAVDGNTRANFDVFWLAILSLGD